MATERDVAGLRCGEVLAQLSDYLDGELEAAARGRIEAHLRGCDVCARFGGVFADAIGALRREADAARPEDAAVLARLRQRLRRDLGA